MKLKMRKMYFLTPNVLARISAPCQEFQLFQQLPLKIFSRNKGSILFMRAVVCGLLVKTCPCFGAQKPL